MLVWVERTRLLSTVAFCTVGWKRASLSFASRRHMLRAMSWQDARMGAISSSNGIDDILKRAMGNRSSLFKRT